MSLNELPKCFYFKFNWKSCGVQEFPSTIKIVITVLISIKANLILHLNNKKKQQLIRLTKENKILPPTSTTNTCSLKWNGKENINLAEQVKKKKGQQVFLFFIFLFIFPYFSNICIRKYQFTQTVALFDVAFILH